MLTQLPDCSSVGDEQWFTTLKHLQVRDLISSRTAAGPFLITGRGANHLLFLRQSSAQRHETVLGDKYEVSGQAGAVGRHAQAYGVNFTQLWNDLGPSVDLNRLAEELPTLRQAMVERAGTAEHYSAIGEVASAETQAKTGNGPRVM